MAVLKQGGFSPDSGKEMTTRGPRKRDTRLCYGCGKQKSDGLFTMNANGKFVCPECAGAKQAGALNACSTDPCSCGTPTEDRDENPDT